MNKKLLAILGIYASGVAAALLYNKKNPSEIKAELENANKTGEKSLRVLFNNFVEIHQNLLDEMKSKVLTEENKELFFTKKDEFMTLVHKFKEKGEDLLQEYKVKGKDYASEGLEKLESFYNESLDELEKISTKAPEKVEEMKTKLLSYFEDVKSKLKK